MIKLRELSTKRLYRENEERFFTEVVRVGKTYKYYEGQYIFRDVKKVAEKYGIEVKYNTGGSMEYTVFGCFNFTIVSLSTSEEPQTFKEPEFFDINELAI